jgi:hypothetical protein
MTISNKYTRCLIGISGALALAGCLLPEKFTAKIDFKSDGNYQYSYSGTAINALAKMQTQSGIALTSKDTDKLKADAELFAKQPDFKRVVYKGDARYEIELEGNRKKGDRFSLMDVLTVSTDATGLTIVESKPISDKNKAEMKKMGWKIDGTLEVKLPKNAEIVTQNATSTPSFGGLFGAYTWKIGSSETGVSMKFRLK